MWYVMMRAHCHGYSYYYYYVLQETRNVTKCRESRTKLEETVETLRKTHMELLHSRDKCALEIKV